MLKENGVGSKFRAAGAQTGNGFDLQNPRDWDEKRKEDERGEDKNVDVACRL